MDNPDQRGAVGNALKILRKATRIVQLAPFAYLVFYVAYMLFGWAVSEEALCIADSLMTVSPVTAGGLLIGSRLFRLCRWHRIACLLPFSSQVEGYIDSYIITFTQGEILLINTTIGIASLVFIILAVKHFTHGRETNTL